MILLDINFNYSITDLLQTIGVIIYTVITFFGTIYIVRTFIAQSKLNADQKRLNELQIKATNAQLEMAERDYKRYISEIEPKWGYEKLSYDKVTGDGHFLAFLTNTPAYNVKFKFKSKAGAEDISLGKDSAFTYTSNVEEKINIKFRVVDKNLFFNEQPFLNYFIYSVEFEDKLNNKYTQRFIVKPDQDYIIKETPVANHKT